VSADQEKTCPSAGSHLSAHREDPVSAVNRVTFGRALMPAVGQCLAADRRDFRFRRSCGDVPRPQSVGLTARLARPYSARCLAHIHTSESALPGGHREFEPLSLSPRQGCPGQGEAHSERHALAAHVVSRDRQPSGLHAGRPGDGQGRRDSSSRQTSTLER